MRSLGPPSSALIESPRLCYGYLEASRGERRELPVSYRYLPLHAAPENHDKHALCGSKGIQGRHHDSLGPGLAQAKAHQQS
jgi:hypothetical protein